MASADPPAAAPPASSAAAEAFAVEPARTESRDASPVSDDLVVALHRQMLLARLVDARLLTLRREGRVALHEGCRGEEAAIVGAAAALRDSDWMFAQGREHAAALWRGMSLENFFHHVFASGADAGKGRQPPDRMASRKAKLAAGGELAGTHVPHAVGFAWAARTRACASENAAVATRDHAVVLCTFDEAATATADFHNGANMAGVFRAPVVFFCRTGAARDGARARSTAASSFAIKAVAYGMPGVRVDGADLFAVLRATRDAVARAARGDGPSLIEASVTRARASDAAGDDAPALSPDRDPIARVAEWLDAKGLMSEPKRAALAQSLEKEIEAAVATAESLAASSPPPPSSIFDDVYATLPWHLVEARAGRAPFKSESKSEE